MPARVFNIPKTMMVIWFPMDRPRIWGRMNICGMCDGQEGINAARKIVYARGFSRTKSLFDYTINLQHTPSVNLNSQSLNEDAGLLE